MESAREVLRFHNGLHHSYDYLLHSGKIEDVKSIDEIIFYALAVDPNRYAPWYVSVFHISSAERLRMAKKFKNEYYEKRGQILTRDLGI